MRRIYTKYEDSSIQELENLTTNWLISDIEKGVIYKLLAQKYFSAKNFELAHIYTDQAIEIFETLETGDFDRDICNELAHLYFTKNRFRINGERVLEKERLLQKKSIFFNVK